MSRNRRPLVAVISMLVLVVIQAVADPTGLLALVGWPGGELRFDLGLWPLASTLVFTPVLLVLVWWSAARAGKFWLLTAGFTIAVLVAQAAAALAMVGDLAVAGRAASYVAAKAVPAALIVAAMTTWLGKTPDERNHRSSTESEPTRRDWPWIPAALFAAVTPLLSGLWWSGPAYANALPTARPDSGVLSVAITVVLLFGATLLTLRAVRPHVTGIWGGWIAALLASALVGLIQGIIGSVTGGGFAGDIWPLMLTYVTVADGLAYAACVGWILGIAALILDTRRRQPAPDDAQPAATKSMVTAGVAALALIIALVPSSATEPAHASGTEVPAGFLRADNGRITDGTNEVLLRGVNVNQLVDFYQYDINLPVTRPLTDADFEQMATYGFTVVRLGLSWSAVEPVRGQLDPTYLATIHDAVDQAAKHGIYTVLDMHQDGWWNEGTAPGTFCRPGTEPMWGFDGAPTWATITDGAPRCQFTGRDISPAGDRAFQHFYFNTDEIRSALAETWGKLAAEFKDNPMVAGFDLLNEPGFGETAPVTTSYLLGEFYDEAIREIRAAGATQIVFVEPSILWSGLGFDPGPQPGFTADTNIVYSPHLYAESITLDRDLGIPPIVSTERQFDLALAGAADYAAPLWSGEYGYWGDDAVERMQRYAIAEDKHMLGSAYWVWKQACGDPQNGIQDIGDGLMIEDCINGTDGGTKAEILEILSRAYPQVAPGTLTSLQGDGASLTMSGTTQQESCDLAVWVPGADKPVPEVSGITQLATEKVNGGWIITGCVTGEYTLSNG